MAKITADTLIAECLELNPNAAEILLSAGMHCFGCALAHGESIAEAVQPRRLRGKMMKKCGAPQTCGAPHFYADPLPAPLGKGCVR